ncbi:MAG: hypothetical protein H6600_02695 [Flavobacteriales bacterium]|nr:hypothetical protein [Flavobacteriales bacterium]
MILQKILPFTIILLCIQVFAQKVEKVNIPFKNESIELKYKDIPFERTYIGKPKISVDSSILKKYQYHDLQKGIKSLMFKFMGSLVLTDEYSLKGKDSKIPVVGAEIFQGFQNVPEANYPLSKIDVNENLFTNNITAVTEDQYGTMWVGYSTGEVSMIRGSQIKTFTYLEGFPHDYISTIKAIDNEIWIGTFGGGLHVFKDNHLTSYNKDNGFPVDHITTICRDADNNTWIGTYNHGIILIKDKQVYHYEQMP